ncbi:MAG TPA: hypothetical protein VK934_02915 [Fimbriimonas sp.]|nr:hypothetical protein [Fimbriimonas sp.]
MRGLPRIAWVGLAILAIAGMMLSLGRRETSALPAADSFAPSGASAFFEMLKRQGYAVEISRDVRPKLKPNDLVVAFELLRPKSFWADVSAEDPEIETPTEFDKTFNKVLLEHFKNGGRAIFLPLQEDYLAASRTAVRSSPLQAVAATGGEPLTTNLVLPVNLQNPLLTELTQSSKHRPVTVWSGPNLLNLVEGVRIEKGVAFVPINGIIATNRFIDRVDNAQLLSQLVHTMAPKGSRIVFTEASFDNIDQKGLLEAIGGWLDAAWQQLLLLGLVIVYTLGKRLGFAEETRGKQRGSRELVDALADTMGRARASHLAMEVTLNRADAELRMALRLPRETSKEKRNDLLPPDLQTALRRLEAAALDKETSEKDALRLIKNVDAAMSAFLGARKATGSSRATIDA